MTLPVAEVIRALLWWLIPDLVRWLWGAGSKDDGQPWRQFVTRCLWCNGAHLVERATPPAADEVPDGWLMSEDKACRWCSLRCWVAHWRADPRVEAPPVSSAGASWPGEWAETDDD